MVYMTDEVRLSQGGLLGMVPVPIGAHYFGPESSKSGVSGAVFTLESARETLAALCTLAT